MGKSALGKGLGQLMGGQKPASKSPPVEATSAGKVTQVDFGRGLSTLVTPQAQDKPQPQRPRVLLPPWFFFSADLLLLAYTVTVCLDSGRPMQTGEILFAATSITLGALLGIMGIRRGCSAA